MIALTTVVWHDREATFTKVVSVEEFNTLMKSCQTVGYRVLKCNASTDRQLINRPVDPTIQAFYDRMSLARTLRVNGFA